MIKFIPAAFLLFFSLLCHPTAGQNASMIYTHVEQMPYFPGCEELENGSEEKRQCSNKALVQYIANNLQYPDEASTEGVEGTALVSFIIDENGFVTEPSILRNIGANCGEAALAVIRGMPAWEPGINEGQQVKVKLNLPVQFNLKGQNQGGNQYKLSWGRMNARQISREELIDNLAFDVFVRDPFGNSATISELILSYSRKRTYLEKRSTGEITAEMKRLIQKKGKKGGKLTLTAAIQNKGRFVFARREYDITE
ncbi:MAG: energy transducer TonB [Bacteroidota bacterium]